MQVIHGKEECPNSNSVFFCDFWEQRKTLTESTEYTERRNVQRAIPCSSVTSGSKERRLRKARNSRKVGMSKEQFRVFGEFSEQRKNQFTIQIILSLSFRKLELKLNSNPTLLSDSRR